MRQIFWTLLLTVLVACAPDAVFAKDIATCGASKGYGYYPKAGLAATQDDAGKWVDDAITGGNFTLAQISEKEFDLLITDSTGRVFSAKQDGAAVMLTGAAKDSVSVLVTYPKTTVTETYTFLRNADGNAEAIWTSSKGGGALFMKVAAYRADCSFLAF